MPSPKEILTGRRKNATIADLMSCVASPVVVLDSGLGGLTVVRSLQRVLPNEDIVYFGDTARLPYGTKTAATVTRFVREIINYLRPFDPKHVIIACNTASAYALEDLQGLAVPVIGVVASALTLHEPLGPGQIAALVFTLSGVVLATRS